MADHGIESKATLLNILSGFFVVHTVVVLAFRLYSRLAVVKAMGTDDVLIVFAGIFALLFCATISIATEYGLGQHQKDIPKEDNRYYKMAMWSTAITYTISLGFIKTSVLALYLRLTPSRTFRRSVKVMLYICCAQTVSSLLVITFQCYPVNHLWDTEMEGKCININAFYMANSVLNICTDFATYALPMRTLWALQMPRPQKLALVVILGLGGFAVLSSIIRITYITPMLSSNDGSWVVVEPMYWSVIELNVGILAVSIPSYRVLVKRWFPRFMGISSLPLPRYIPYNSSHRWRRLRDSAGDRASTRGLLGSLFCSFSSEGSEVKRGADGYASVDGEHSRRVTISGPGTVDEELGFPGFASLFGGYDISSGLLKSNRLETDKDTAERQALMTADAESDREVPEGKILSTTEVTVVYERRTN